MNGSIEQQGESSSGAYVTATKLVVTYKTLKYTVITNSCDKLDVAHQGCVYNRSYDEFGIYYQSATAQVPFMYTTKGY